MREIKFRALIRWPTADGLGRTEWYYWDGNNHNDHDAHMVFHDAKIVGDPQQYAGLKDKNGTEIYEGDVVTSNYARIGQVVLDIRKDCFVTNSPLYDGVTGYGSNTCEVIGNIHENPELLS